MIRAGTWVVAGMLALGSLGGAYADAPDDMPDHLKRCLYETDTVELRTCLRNLGQMAQEQEQNERKIKAGIRDCMRDDSVEAMRICLTYLVSEKERASQRREDAIGSALRTWAVSREESRMDGSSRVFLSLESEDEIPVGFGLRRRPVLHLRCVDNVTTASIASDWFLGETVPVQWRVDHDKAVTQTWGRASPTGNSAGLWYGARSVPFAKSLLGKSTLTMRVTSFQDGAKEMAFNITGLDNVIGPLREACKW